LEDSNPRKQAYMTYWEGFILDPHFEGETNPQHNFSNSSTDEKQARNPATTERIPTAEEELSALESFLHSEYVPSGTPLQMKVPAIHDATILVLESQLNQEPPPNANSVGSSGESAKSNKRRSHHPDSLAVGKKSCQRDSNV
jgi:hypothetical protein